MEQGTAVSAIPCFKPLVLLSLALPQKNGVLRRLGELPLLHLEQGVVIPGEVVDRLNLPVHLERIPLLGVQKNPFPMAMWAGSPSGIKPDLMVSVYSRNTALRPSQARLNPRMDE